MYFDFVFSPCRQEIYCPRQTLQFSTNFLRTLSIVGSIHSMDLTIFYMMKYLHIECILSYSVCQEVTALSEDHNYTRWTVKEILGNCLAGDCLLHYAKEKDVVNHPKRKKQIVDS